MKIRLGENIKELRTSRGITQSELADNLFVTPQTVSRWENGQSYPDIQLLPSLAAYFDVTLDDLMGTSSLLYQKRLEELQETYIALQKGEDIELRKEYCRILKKLTDLSPGTHDIAYFGAIMRLYKSGHATDAQVEEARKACEEFLPACYADERPLLLVSIISHEDDEHLDRWRKYIAQNGHMCCWGDVMLQVYRGKSLEKWEKQRQNNLFSRIWDALNLLVSDKPDSSAVKYDSNDLLNPIEQYEAALQTLNVFSKEDDDIFLSMRIFIENRYMQALFASGRNEDGFAWMEKLSEHALLLEQRTGEKRHGSVSFLTLQEESDVPRDAEAYSSIGDICNAEHHRAFDDVRNDPRFVQFYDRMHKLLSPDRDSIFYVKPEDEIPFSMEDFTPLIQYAHNEIKNFSDSGRPQIIVVQTERGNLYHLKLNHRSPLSAKAEEIEFIKNLKANKDIVITKIVCMWADGMVSIPSYHLREQIFRAHKQNRNALLLLNGTKKLIAKKLIDFFPQEKEL